MSKLRGFKVKRLTVPVIRALAEKVRATFGKQVKTYGQLIEFCLAQGWVDIIANDDKSVIPLNIEACYIPEQKCILLRERDYIGIVTGTRPRAKFTFWHEFGHFLLGHQRSLNRETSTAEHDYTEDSEWQANTFAAEILMPLSIIRRENLTTAEEICSRFRVSKQAAEVRILTLIKERR